MKFGRIILIFFITFISLSGVYIWLLTKPEFFFENRVQVENLEIYSSEAYSVSAVKSVLKLAIEKLERSPFYSAVQPYRIFVCDRAWLRLIFMRDPHRAGGENLTDLRTTFLGAVSFEKNRMLKPDGTFAPENRPLHYFIAHEITHQMVGDYLGWAKNLDTPSWMLEGYADYVAKGDDFNFAAELEKFRKHEISPDPWRTEYDVENLAIHELLDVKKNEIHRAFSKTAASP